MSFPVRATKLIYNLLPLLAFRSKPRNHTEIQFHLISSYNWKSFRQGGANKTFHLFNDTWIYPKLGRSNTFITFRYLKRLALSSFSMPVAIFRPLQSDLPLTIPAPAGRQHPAGWFNLTFSLFMTTDFFFSYPKASASANLAQNEITADVGQRKICNGTTIIFPYQSKLSNYSVCQFCFCLQYVRFLVEVPRLRWKKVYLYLPTTTKGASTFER